MIEVGQVWEKFNPEGDYWEREECSLVIITNVTDEVVRYRCHIYGIENHYRNVRPIKEFEYRFRLYQDII
jgi:hypothetical protein